MPSEDVAALRSLLDAEMELADLLLERLDRNPRDQRARAQFIDLGAAIGRDLDRLYAARHA